MTNFTELTDEKSKTGASTPPQLPPQHVGIDNIDVLQPICKRCGNHLLAANLGKGGASLKCKGCGILSVSEQYMHVTQKKM
jgi:hypothetical protein